MSSVAVIGVDVGGSKTHGVRAEIGVGHGLASGPVDMPPRVVSEATVGSASLSSVGVVEVARQLDRLLEQLDIDGVGAVCVGSAGVDAPGAEARLQSLVQERFPGVPVLVVHDTHLVLAAAGLRNGVVGISGTGSAAWGRNADGAEIRASGWGYLLGDDGSAYGVVRAAMRHVLNRSDADDPADRLTRELLASASVGDSGELLDCFYSTPSRREWAARAPLVFALAEDGDPVCLAIVAQAADEVVLAVTRVGRRLGMSGPVVLAGGVAVHQPLMHEAVSSGLAAAGIGPVQVLHRAPVHGAVSLAAALLADGELAR